MDYLPPPQPGESEPKAARRKPSGIIGTAGAAILAFLLKFKLALLLGLKLLAPGWTFLLSLWIYVAFFGWRLALVVMLVLLAHELGHYAAFRAYGLPVRLPHSFRCSERSRPARRPRTSSTTPTSRSPVR